MSIVAPGAGVNGTGPAPPRGSRRVARLRFLVIGPDGGAAVDVTPDWLEDWGATLHGRRQGQAASDKYRRATSGIETEFKNTTMPTRDLWGFWHRMEGNPDWRPGKLIDGDVAVTALTAVGLRLVRASFTAVDDAPGRNGARYTARIGWKEKGALEPEGYTLQPESDPFKWAGGDLGNHYKMPGNSFGKHWHPAKGGKPDWSAPYRATKLNANTELFVRLLGVQFYVVEADGKTVKGPLDLGGVPFLRKVAGSTLKPPAEDGEPYKDAQGSYKDRDGRTYDFKGLWYLAGRDGKPDWSKPITSDVVVDSNLRVFARVVGATLYVREPPEGGAAVGRDEKVGYVPLARGDELPEPGPAFAAAEAAYNKKTGVASHDNGIPFDFSGKWHMKAADGSIDWKRPYRTQRVWESMSLYTRLFRVTTQVIDEDGNTSTRTVDVPDGTVVTDGWKGLTDHGNGYNDGRGSSFAFKGRWHPGKDWGTPLGRVTVDRNTTISTRLFRVHFMVDTGSGKVEVHTAVKVVGEELKSGDGSFKAAESAFKKRWPGRVWDFTEKWYRGDSSKPDTAKGKFTSKVVMSEIWV